MLALLYGLLSASPALSARLAGNEDYAYAARQSLAHSPTSGKRGVTSGLAFQPASVSFTVGDKQYLSPTGPQFRRYSIGAEWGLDALAGQSLAVTVLEVEGEVTCDVLGSKLDKFQQADDVWDTSFLNGIFLTTTSSYHVASDVSSCLEGWGGSLVVKSGNATSDVEGVSVAKVASVSIPQGPYLAHVNGNISLTQIYRSYRDEAQAFTAGVIHTEDNTFVDLSTPVPALNTLSISVPSRLYTLNVPNPRPLEGRRIAVKDLFDMAGLKTGGGNRAYYNTYPAKNVTAIAIQRLVDQGGIIVGRVKTSQFANGEDATADWVDQMCPFNPRGDGYQQPASSSSGPGAAAGAYDWLDYTIGSDTGGSIIDPASVQGVYGLRPSWSAISLEGAIPLQATQDTAGFFARDAQAGLAFAQGWYGDRFGNFSTLPTNLILPNSSWEFAPDFAGAEQFNAFRDGLLDLVKPASIDVRDFEGYWNTSGRFEQVNATASNYLYEVYANLITYYQWNNFGKLWFEDYAEQNDGRQPFVDPSPLVRWTYARDNLTEADFNSSTAKKELFKEFIDTEVLVKDNSTCSSAIYVAPYGLAQTAYRNIYKQAASVPFGFYYPAQFSGVPQLIVPIGQLPYESTITNHTEYLPLTVTLYAAADCDYVLWDLAAKLEAAGVTSSVAAGAVAYPDRV